MQKHSHGKPKRKEDYLRTVRWVLYIDSWYISTSERTDLLRYTMKYLERNQMNTKSRMVTSKRIELINVHGLILSNLLYCRFTWAFSLMVGSTRQYHSLVVMMFSRVSIKRQLSHNWSFIVASLFLHLRNFTSLTESFFCKTIFDIIISRKNNILCRSNYDLWIWNIDANS